MALYQTIIRDDLKIPDVFFREYAALIRGKLQHAAGELGQTNGKSHAVSQCLHLASGVVLRHQAHLEETLDKLRSMPGMEGQDARAVWDIVSGTFIVSWRARTRL